MDELTEAEREFIVLLCQDKKTELFNEGKPLHEEDAETYAQVIERCDVIIGKLQ